MMTNGSNKGACGIRGSAAAKPRTRDSRGRFVAQAPECVLRDTKVGLVTEVAADRAAFAFGRCGCGRNLTEAVRYSPNGDPLIASGCESAFDGGPACTITLNRVAYPRGVSYRAIQRRVLSGRLACDTTALGLAVSVPDAGFIGNFINRHGNSHLKRLALPLMAMAGMAIALAL